MPTVSPGLTRSGTRWRPRVALVFIACALGPVCAVQAQGLPEHQRKTLGKHADTVEAKARELGLVLDFDKPPKLLKTLPPKYPDEAFRKRRNGRVLVMAVVDASGRVHDVEVLEASEGFEAAALDCVRGWKFKPAAKDGKPVGTVVTAPVSFTVM